MTRNKFYSSAIELRTHLLSEARKWDWQQCDGFEVPAAGRRTKQTQIFCRARPRGRQAIAEWRINGKRATWQQVLGVCEAADRAADSNQ